MTTTATLRQPFPHQRRAIEQLKLWSGRAMLCDEMGLGKSSTALWALDELGSDPVIVVCPLSVVHKWATEIMTTLGKKAHVLSGLTPKKQRLALQDADVSCLVLHYESVGKLLAGLLAYVAESPSGLILDESHYIKTRTSDRSHAAAKLAAACRHVLCLTGTPVRNNILDLWHQVHVARPGHLFDYSRFEARYTRSVRIQFPSMPRPVTKYDGTKNEPELAARLLDVMVKREKKDVFDLPEKLRTVVPLEMGKTERERYLDMKRTAMVVLEEAIGENRRAVVEEPWSPFGDNPPYVIARTALEQVIRLEQLTCGVLGGSSLDTPATFPEAAKIQWTLETIEDLRAQGRSCVVFCKFNATIDMLKAAIPEPDMVGVLTGATASQERQPIIDRFRADESAAHVLLCQLKLAEGFDLTPCTDAIFLGLDWTPAMMDQAEARLHRIGTTGTVNCYYPQVHHSIDERIYRIVMVKREDASKVLGPKALMEELR